MPSYINIERWLQDGRRYHQHAPACFCYGGFPLHHIDLNLKGQRATGTAWGTGYPLSFACLKGKQSHTCPPALSRLLASWARHGTSHPAVVIMLEYESTAVPVDGRSSHKRGGTYQSDAVHRDRRSVISMG